MIEEHRGRGRHDDLMRPHPPEEEAGGWVVSYLDVMTLLVVLMTLLVVMGRIGVGSEAPSAPVAAPAPTLGVPLPPPLQRARAGRDASPAEVDRLSPRALSAALGVAGLPAPSEPPPAGAKVPSETAVQVARAVSTPRELPVLDGVEVTRIPEGMRLRVEDRLLFPTAEAELTEEGRALVTERLHEVVQRHAGEVAVEGHSDSRPIRTERFPSNWALSSARAIAIVEALVAAGVDPGRLRAVGLAGTRPLASNDTADGRARNRRVEVVIQAR